MKAKETSRPVGTNRGLIPRLQARTDLRSTDDPVVRVRLAHLYREVDISRVECAALLQALQALLRHIECGDRQTAASPRRLCVCGIAVNDPTFEADVRHARMVVIDERAAAAVRSRRAAKRADATLRA